MANRSRGRSSGHSRGLIRKEAMVLGAIGFVFTLLFQNCDGGFQYDPNSGQISALASSVGNSDFKLTTFNSFGLPVPEGQSFDGGVEYKIVASGDKIATGLLSWAMSENTGNCTIKAGTGPTMRFFTCDKSGRVTVKVTSVWPDGTSTSLSTSRTTAELVRDLCGVSDANRTVFRIPLGTGTSPWNSAASPVVMFVGQVLRICNDDTANHQLGTTGSPCAQQGAPMAKGQIYDCPIANTTVTGLYDVVAGASATFSIRTLDGAPLYADTSKTANGSSCASCHSAFATSAKKGSSFTSIKNAITNNTGGMGTYNGRITDDEIRAIAFALSR